MTTSPTLLNTLITTIATWRQRSRARRTLAQLGPHMLRDLGIDPGLVAFEAAQPFWRALAPLRERPESGAANDLAAIPPGRKPQHYRAA